MKTRSFLLVALIATGFFTACNNDVAVESLKSGQEISFRLQGGMPEVATRATATTLNNLDAFVVYGTDDVLAGTGELLFEGVTVSRQFDPLGGAPIFTYAPRAYYSAGAQQAGFFTFSPVSAHVSNVNVSAFLTGASMDYTVPFPDDNGIGNAAQEDLLVAIADVYPLSTTVSLEFEHALARIFVSALNDTEDPVIIKKLELLNLATSGTLNVSSTFTWGWTPDLATVLPTNIYEYILAPSGVVVPIGTTTTPLMVTSMEQGMLILPQDAVNDYDDWQQADFALKVTYDIANLTNQEEYVYIPSTASPFPFAEGTQYNIIIRFTGLTAIEFEVIDVDPFLPNPPTDVNP